RTYVLTALENPYQVAYEIENGNYREIDFRPDFEAGLDEEQLELPEVQAGISLYSPNPDWQLITEKLPEIFHFKEIELLSENEIRLPNSLGEEINTTYRVEDGKIVLDQDGRDLIVCCTNQPPINNSINTQEIRSGMHHYFLYYYEPFAERRSSLLVFDGLSNQFTNPKEAIEHIIEDEQVRLTTKDTVFLTLANWVYQLEN
ncbi:MAG: hypothetical protein AAF599_19905, partial [Bacteroidota bacterium]